MPSEVKDELSAVALVLPLVASRICCEIDPVSRTDATPTVGGGAKADAGPELSASPFRLCECRGQYARLDWRTLDE
jgi:hypothetical protein